MTTRKDTIRKTAEKVAESKARATTARVNLLTHAMKQILKEAGLKNGSLFAVSGMARAALDGDERIASMKHPIREVPKLEDIPAYVPLEEWRERPENRAKGPCKCGCGQVTR